MSVWSKRRVAETKHEIQQGPQQLATCVTPIIPSPSDRPTKTIYYYTHRIATHTQKYIWPTNITWYVIMCKSPAHLFWGKEEGGGGEGRNPKTSLGPVFVCGKSFQ